MEEKKEKTFEKREELIKAALKEFSEKGYEKASLNNILKEAQISKGTFYYHFKNKEDLYFYLIGILVEEKKNFFKKGLKPEDINQDIFTLFHIQAKLGIQFAQSSPLIYQFSQSFLKERGTKIYEKVLKKYQFREDKYFCSFVETAFQKGELREDLPKDFILQLISYLFSHMAEITNSFEIHDFPQNLYYFIEFMKDGLRKK